MPLTFCAADVAGGIHAGFLDSVTGVVKAVDALTFDLEIYQPSKGWEGKGEYSRKRREKKNSAQLPTSGRACAEELQTAPNFVYVYGAETQ